MAGENTKIEFWDETTGTNVPKPFVPGVRKGFEDSCQKGLMAGQKVVGVRMRLQDGANHQVNTPPSPLSKLATSFISISPG